MTGNENSKQKLENEMHTFQAPKYVKLCTKFPCYSQIDEI